MQDSQNPKVQDFINSIDLLDETKSQILAELRKIIFEVFPQVTEKMMYGGIMFILEDYFAGIFVYKKHVSLEFSFGAKLDDPEQLLNGKGKQRRHLKFESLEEVEEKKVAFFVAQIGGLDKY